jgi:tRNA(Ile)-lysidine synthase
MRRPGPDLRRAPSTRATRMTVSNDPVTSALIDAGRQGLLPREGQFLLAVSGGPDSLALLDAMAELAPRFLWTLAVGHVDHGWRGRAAARDLAFVARESARRNLPFESRRLALIKLRGRSREDAAREQRYAALHEMARQTGSERIVTAHTEDDAAETLLLALLRGGGLEALSGIRVLREDGVVRPLLAVSRRDIQRYLASRRLRGRRDASNRDLTLDRNRLRKRILPRLERTFGPGTARRIARSAARLTEDRQLLARLFDQEVRPLLRIGPEESTADATKLAGLPASLRRRALQMLVAPWSRPSGPALTGKELDALDRLLISQRSFHFEAGRIARVTVRRGVLRVVPRYRMGRERKLS